MKLLITGGHVTPALAIIDAISNSEFKNTEILFVGRKSALESDKNLSLEYQEVVNRNIRFISLNTGRLSRILSLRSVKNLLKTPFGFFQAWQIIREEKPNIILSFGGYIALPICLIGYFYRIPIYTHEQTIKPGLANRIISRLAQKVFCAFPKTISYFPKYKTIVSGNPVRKSIYEIKSKPFKIDLFKNKVIFITGGSLGSHSINQHIKEILTQLLNKYIVIHQAGNIKEYDDYAKLMKLKENLPKDLAQKYFLVKHFFENEIGYIYSLADLVIGRAGANTFFELIVLQKPAILIPLPWSANKEQQAHAIMFKENKVGEIFFQSQSSQELLHLINKVLSNIEEYKDNFKRFKMFYKNKAAEIIINEIFK